METPEEMMHQIGAFEPFEAKRVLTALDARGIPFEVESDHSALATPFRWMELSVGIYPEGSKLAVFVPESKLPAAEQVLSVLFPI